MDRRGKLTMFLSISAFGATVIGAVPDLQAQISWASAPAVLAKGVTSGSLDDTTMIFGYSSIPAGGVHIINNNRCNPSRWYDTFADLFSGGGVTGWDGDPAVAYSDTGSNFWVCGHDSGGVGGIYCQRAHMMTNCATSSTYDNSPDRVPVRVGTGTFPPGSSPALFRSQSIFGSWGVWLFARGWGNQIWYATRGDGGSSWASWFQMPSLPGGFDSSPAATYFSAGRLIVCARQASNARYACAHHEFGIGAQLNWSGWTEVSGYPQVGTKPALATDDSLIYLFGVSLGGAQTMLVSSLPIGGGSWSGNTEIAYGSGFLSGPGAIRVSPASKALTVVRSGSAFFWTTGSSSTWTSGWTQLPF